MCVVSCASERGDSKADLLAEISGGVERVTPRRELPGVPGGREHSHGTPTTLLILAACPGFGWDRVHFLPSGWYSVMVWI